MLRLHQVVFDVSNQKSVQAWKYSLKETVEQLLIEGLLPGGQSQLLIAKTPDHKAKSLSLGLLTAIFQAAQSMVFETAFDHAVHKEDKKPFSIRMGELTKWTTLNEDALPRLIEQYLILSFTNAEISKRLQDILSPAAYSYQILATPFQRAKLLM